MTARTQATPASAALPGAAGATRPPARFFRIYVLVGLLGIAAYFLLPPAAQNVAFLASNLVAFATVTSCWRRRALTPSSGWLLLAAFPAATALGNAIYFVNDSILHVAPFPSIGDAAFLGGYLFLAAGLLRLQQARSARRDVSAVLDTAIISVGFAAVSWVFLMADLLHDPEQSLLERLTALGYPVADVLVVAVSARFFLTARRRGPVFSWLAGTVVVMLAADTGFAVLNLLGVYSTGNPIDALILAYNLGWGAVALHRDSADLTMPPRRTEARSSGRRLTLLCIASLGAPLMLLAESIRGRFADVSVLSAAAVVLFLLVMARMVGLVRQVEAVLNQREKLSLELEHRAHHDDLTGLANRRMFVERLQQVLAERPEGGTEVLFIDLDRFKAINDSLGHKAGDDLLVVTAQRLAETLRAGDTVARLGGDEFAVLLEAPAPSSVDSLLEVTLQQPVRLHGLDVQVSASIGFARASQNDTLEELIHRADLAMYAQKSRMNRRRSPLTTPNAGLSPAADAT